MENWAFLLNFICFLIGVESTVIEGPSNVTYFRNVTQLPIELTCNVTGVAAWRVNGSSYTLSSLTDGDLPGHSRTGTNILVNSPVNNTDYVCVSLTIDSEIRSDPAYIVIAGPPSISSVNGEACVNDVVLSWSVLNNQSTVFYNLTILSSGNVTNTRTINETNSTISYTLNGLTFDTAYTVRVQPFSIEGIGEIRTVDIATAPNTVLIRLLEARPTYIVIQIMQFEEGFCGDEKYNTTVHPSGGRLVIIKNQTMLMHNVTELNESTTYTITTVALRGSVVVHKTIRNVDTPSPTIMETTTTGGGGDGGSGGGYHLDNDNDDPDDSIIIIIVVVVVVVGGGTAGGTTIGIGIYKKRQKAKRTVPSQEKCDNEHAATNDTSDHCDALQGNTDNLEYAYAITGPRKINFSSATTEMPQKQ